MPKSSIRRINIPSQSFAVSTAFQEADITNGCGAMASQIAMSFLSKR